MSTPTVSGSAGVMPAMTNSTGVQRGRILVHSGKRVTSWTSSRSQSQVLVESLPVMTIRPKLAE